MVGFGELTEWAGKDSNVRLTDHECRVCRAFGSGKRFSGQARWGCRAFDRPSWEHAGNTTGDRAVAHPRCAAPRAAAGLLEANARERDPSGGPTLWPHERLLELLPIYTTAGQRLARSIPTPPAHRLAWRSPTARAAGLGARS